MEQAKKLAILRLTIHLNKSYTKLTFTTENLTEKSVSGHSTRYSNLFKLVRE